MDDNQTTKLTIPPDGATSLLTCPTAAVVTSTLVPPTGVVCTTTPIYRHAFACGVSPDMAAWAAGDDPGVYIIQCAINGRKQPAVNIPGSLPALSFWVDAPGWSNVDVQVTAVNGKGEESMPIVYSFAVSGKRVLQHPGAHHTDLHMTSVTKMTTEAVGNQMMVNGRPVANGQDYLAINDDERGQMFNPSAVGVIMGVQLNQEDYILVAAFQPFDLTKAGDAEEPVTVRFFANAKHTVQTHDGRKLTVAEYITENSPARTKPKRRIMAESLGSTAGIYGTTPPAA